MQQALEPRILAVAAVMAVNIMICIVICYIRIKASLTAKKLMDIRGSDTSWSCEDISIHLRKLNRHRIRNHKKLRQKTLDELDDTTYRLERRYKDQCSDNSSGTIIGYTDA